jgi:cation transport regulator ChaB
MKLLLLLLLLAVMVGSGSAGTEAHAWADTVLAPRFTAAINEWAWRHPQDAEGRQGEHWRKLDAGDVKRWAAVRKAFRELDDEFRKAGY